MTDQSERRELRDRLGSSGVFRAIADVSRKVKRALSESEREPSPEAVALAYLVGRAFVDGRYGDVHALGTPALQHATRRDRFEAGWRDAVQGRGPLTGFEMSDVGDIDLAFIPGLEDVPQGQFVAFVEVAFASPEIPAEDERAFTVGVVVLDDSGAFRIGAIHTR